MVAGRLYACSPHDLSGKGEPAFWRSDDSGETWSVVAKEVFTDAPWAGPKHQLAFGPDGSFLCVPWKAGGLYRFDRETQSWGRVSEVGVLPEPDPFAPGRFVRPGNQAAESTDGGRTFRDAPELRRFWRIAFDGQVKGLAVGSSGDGFYVSYDGARTFEKISDSLNVPSGARRDVYVGGGRVFLLTTGSGLWMADLPRR